MTITQFLALFPHVIETTNGWKVCCPAHDDHDPSLGVREGEAGRILLYCWSRCTVPTICERLGIRESDLFPDAPLTAHARPLRLPPVKTSPRKLAFAYELHAVDLRTKAQAILDVAARCTDCDTWTNDDRETAMKAIHPAYVNLERAQFCESYADHLREQEWEGSHVAS